MLTKSFKHLFLFRNTNAWCLFGSMPLKDYYGLLYPSLSQLGFYRILLGNYHLTGKLPLKLPLKLPWKLPLTVINYFQLKTTVCICSIYLIKHLQC